MSRIFETKDKSGRNLYMSDERWSHINREHPEVTHYLEEIKETLRNPMKITKYELDEDIRYYYNYFKEITKYLLVIVKYLNNHGFIITAYFVRHIK